MSGILEIWYLLHDGQSVPNYVNVPVGAKVADLRDAIGDKLHSQRIEVKSQSLTLWKPIKELPNGDEAKDVLAEWIYDANGRFDDTVATWLKKPQERVNSFINRTNDTLVQVIVQVGQQERYPSASPELRKIRNIIGSEQKLLFYVNKFNEFKEGDLNIEENQISFARGTGISIPLSRPLGDLPEFLKQVLDSLGKRRRLSEELKSKAQYTILVDQLREDVLSDLFETVSEGGEVTEQELSAYCGAIQSARRVPFVNQRSSHYKDGHFTVNLIDPIFGDASHEEDSVSYDKGVTTQPQMLVREITSNSQWRTYKPMSDFCVYTKNYVPILIGETISRPDQTDRVRMLLQAAVYVRVGNALRKKDPAEGTVPRDNSSEASIVLVCLYLNSNFEAERYLVYQPDAGSEKVEILCERKFTLSNKEEAVWFMFELFNYHERVLPHIISRFDVARKGTLKELAKHVRDLKLYSFSRRGSKGRSESQNPSKKTTGRDDNSGLSTIAENDQLLMSHNLYTDVNSSLYHRSHVALARKADSGDEFVVKAIKKGSQEFTILHFLNSPELRSQPQNHTIPVVDIIDVASNNTCIVVMPKLVQYCPELITETAPSVLCDYLYQLVEGVAFLHSHHISHLDLKTANIVVDTNAQKLYIIDYDCAMRLHDPEEQISEFVGTEDWTAPEVGKGDYSPIRADRWAVGELILHAFMYCEQLGELGHLSEIAIRLQDTDPTQRPALKDLLAVRRADEHPDALYPEDSMFSLRPTTPFPQQPTTVMVA
ncbi:hypothetical protein WOLCODRAFT_167453 [Wolfiporia cocos MD-104 SS10]|uniref:Protein kinase domain-containing protein n=1 Tax=Wolfiporia cocos (strain MD-104) TaxID=742152 RepID=A0A2H3J5A6_WOLCO|nr:hypothetical protein WOLCODRAFT_167453 [Wolfiporia cocos MD-104 SS10]